MSSEFNMPMAVARLRTELFSSYLRARGWAQRQSEFKNRIYFEGEIHEGGEPYKLYLPASTKVPRYRTLLQRAVYFLCEVEDREPCEIIPDILAHEGKALEDKALEDKALEDKALEDKALEDKALEDKAEATPKNTPARRLRVRNSAQSPLRLAMKTRSGEHQLLPGEFIELMCASDVVEIEQTESGLTIDDRCE